MPTVDLGPCECCELPCHETYWLVNALGYTFSQVQVTVNFKEGDFSGLGERKDVLRPVPDWVPSPTPMNGTYVFDWGLHYQTREPVSRGYLLEYYIGSVPPNEPPDQREDALLTYTNYIPPNTPNKTGDILSNGPAWSLTTSCSDSFFGVTATAFTNVASKLYTIRDTPNYQPSPNSYAAVHYGNTSFFSTQPGGPKTVERDFTSCYLTETPIRQLDDGRWLVFREIKTGVTAPPDANADIFLRSHSNNPFTVDVDISLA